MNFFSCLTVRFQSLLVLILLGLFTLNAFAGSSSSEFIEIELQNGKVVKITARDLDTITSKIEDEVNNSNDPNEQTLLRKMNQQFASFSDAVKSKKETFFADEKVKKRRIKVAEIATKISVATNRPFMNAAGFLTGFFQNTAKDKEAYYFLQFFLNHSEEFDELYKEVGTFEEYSLAFEKKMEEILIYKIGVIISDAVLEVTGREVSLEVVYKTIGVEPFASDSTIATIHDSIDVFDIDDSKLHPSLINEHPEYQDLRPLLGDVKMSDITDLILGKQLEAQVDTVAILNGVSPKIYELGFAYFSKLIVPKMVIGIISKSVASVVTSVGTLADIGAITSALVCTKNRATIKAIQTDKEIREFCSFVVNQSAYELMKSRSKGFIKGKKARQKFLRLSKKVKMKFKNKKLQKNKL